MRPTRTSTRESLNSSVGLAPGTYRVNRGGSWNNNRPSWVRAANRNRNEPSNRNAELGFRCARGTTPGAAGLRLRRASSVLPRLGVTRWRHRVAIARPRWGPPCEGRPHRVASLGAECGVRVLRRERSALAREATEYVTVASRAKNTSESTSPTSTHSARPPGAALPRNATNLVGDRSLLRCKYGIMEPYNPRAQRKPRTA